MAVYTIVFETMYISNRLNTKVITPHLRLCKKRFVVKQKFDKAVAHILIIMHS